MNREEKLNYILEKQSEGVPLEKIAEGLDLSPKAVRSFMGRLDYISKKGVFYKKEVDNSGVQLTLGINMEKQQKNDEKLCVKKDVSITTSDDFSENVKFIFAAEKTGQRSVLKLTNEFDDKMRELIDWYNDVKNLPQLKHKITRKNKSVIIEEDLSQETVGKKILIDRKCFEDLTVLIENTGVDINLFISQCIKDGLKTYKHLF